MTILESLALGGLIIWALFRVGPLNHAIAWLAGARWGQSISAYLWALDKGYASCRWLDWLGAKTGFDRWPPAATMAVTWCWDVAVRALRLFVDFVPWALVRQSDHCLEAFKRESR